MKKTFGKSIILTLIISLTVLAGGCAKKSTATSGDTQTAGNSKKKIVVATNAEYPPYEFHAKINGEDKIVGFDMDIANEIAKDMGATIEVVDMNFDGLLAALTAKKADMVIAGMTPSEERKKSVDFSKLYYNATHGVVTKKEIASSIKSFDDLNGKVIAVQQGTIQADLAKEKIKSPKEIKEVPKITDMILMLQSGKVDAIIMELPVSKSYVKTNNSLALTSIEVTDEAGGSAVAVRKGETDMVNQINKTIDRLLKEGKIDQFFTDANKLAEEQK